jgi:hypothetical protein
MKSDKLNIHIRKIVREEVAMAIHEVINEITKPSQPSRPKKSNKQRFVEKQTYSKNSVLNDVLNETAQTAVLEEGDNPLAKMNNVMQSSYGDMMTNNTSNVSAEDTSGMGKFLNKDYSEVLNKSYEKSGNK